ncbi:hypothetical protein [Limnobacter parvus]|uniref:Uncharacterized protein n=1 Tax=Limnobacter parvus TaxID=2939690 RepID=A0ABT1XDY3_9BURK|nr:hypothetical protein [Limnobacter parvus]MCR2745490.1 hypothetical protein [Limnobacter parvus]
MTSGLREHAAQCVVWVMHRLAGFARLPGGFAARGDCESNRCEDAFAFRMPQARSITPESEALLRQGGASPKPHQAPSTKHQAPSTKHQAPYPPPRSVYI